MKTSSLDIDLNLLDKEQLIAIILYAHEHDITFNESIVRILELFIENEKTITN
jgi:hypothetical protein